MPRNFPNWLKAYTEYTSISESPTSFHFWTGVSTLAGALRRRVWRDERIFQWTPNFYIILVAPPGVVTKSTSVSIGMDLLRQVEGIRFGPESMTWQGLAKAFKDATEYVKYIGEDGLEATEPMSPLTIPISELGTFLRADDSSLVSFLTRMWDGLREPFIHRTSGEGETIVPNPWLNLIGATTPAWLRANFPENMIGEGLTSRIVFVYAEEKRHFVAYPSRQIKGKDYYEFRELLIADLKHISTLAGPYILTPEAEQWGEMWYEQHHTSRPAHMASDRYGGYLARKQTHMHKLALIIAASKRDQLVIELEDLQEAKQLLGGVEHDMLKVFESIGLVDEAKWLGEVASMVKALGKVDGQELWTRCMNVMKQQDFKNALRQGVESGILEVVIDSGKRYIQLARRTIN